MSARRLGLALALLTVGVLLLFLATSQVWFRGNGTTWKGSDERGFSALALGVLAAGAALLATRGWARRLVGVLTAALGCGIVALVVHTHGERATLLQKPGRAVVALAGRAPATTSGWPVAALVAGLLVVAGAVFAVLAGDRPVLSARHEPPGGAPPAPAAAPARDFADVAAWQALDRDEDPTGA